MFAASLLPHPPPSTFLLPTLSQPNPEPVQQSHLHTQSRRKPTTRINSPLASLSHDERLITSRKLAIAMYGYSWLKPAGCTKTMLGRREEELEREEVERQLREVELQERMAIEQEEQARREELRRQANGAEIVDERNLDNDIPDADRDGEQESSDGGEDEDGEDDNEGVEEDLDDNEADLDDEIPEADTEGADDTESSWVYDTRREPDTESESDGHETHPRQPRNSHLQSPIQPHYAGDDDPAATEAMVNAMLEEDELGDMEVDLDGSLSDRDLDDEVPSADEDDDPGWEHTDSELEESEMDISLLPPHPSSSSRNPGTTHEEMRRVSGNRMLPPPLPPPSQSRGQQQQHQQPFPRTAPRQNPRAMMMMMQTPGTADDISALISTGSTSAVDTGPSAVDAPTSPRSPNRRNWLNPAGARRNLFGGFRGNSSTTITTTTTTTTAPVAATSGQPSTTTATAATFSRTGISSGGLFTPSPRQLAAAGDDGSDDEGSTQPPPTLEPPRSRTRSGRLLGGLSVARRGRRPRDQDT